MFTGEWELGVHNVPEDLFERLAIVFESESSANARWVSIKTERGLIRFFANPNVKNNIVKADDVSAGRAMGDKND